MAGLSLNTARGRLIHDTAARLLDGVADPNNPLIVSDCLALAELRVRADELRRDLASDPNVVIKLEGLIDRRMRRLGLDKQHKLTASSAPTFADIATQAQADAARRRAHELAADAADDEGGTAPGRGAGERPANHERGTGEIAHVPDRFERARVGDQLELGDGRVIEVVEDDPPERPR
jgi:hypothetical protein